VPPAIKVDNLTHVYSPGTPFQVVALENISLEIEKGEFYALVGASGSGKSTLVQHFNGLLTPTGGKVWVGGVDLSDRVSRRGLWRTVGLVFQYPEQQLFEETVFDDVAFGPRNLGLGKDEVRQRVEDALRLVGLDPRQVGGRSPFSLSSGMRRRVAIAGVLALKPEILVLDEPAAGLDPAGRRLLMDRIEDFQRTHGLTVVLVTHDMGEVARRAGRMAVLNKGALVMEGRPGEIFSRVEELRAVGLDIPEPAELMHRLRADGRQVRTDILTAGEAEEEIAKLFVIGRKAQDA